MEHPTKQPFPGFFAWHCAKKALDVPPLLPALLPGPPPGLVSLPLRVSCLLQVSATVSAYKFL